MKNKLIIAFLLITNFIYSQTNFKINTKPNVITESCYRDPCSVSKSISTKIISQNENQTVLKIKLLGGEKEMNSKKIIWNKNPHEITIKCSKTKPRINNEFLPLNSDGVPGVLYSSAELYFNYCHSWTLSVEEAIDKFKYKVH